MRDKGREAEMRKQKHRRGAAVEMEVDVEVAEMINFQQDGLKGKIQSSVQVLLLRARCVV